MNPRPSSSVRRHPSTAFSIPMLVAIVWSSSPHEAGFADEPAPKLHRYEASEPHMGTLFELVLYAADEATASTAAQAAFARIARADSIYSDYDDRSELSRLSASAGGPPIAIGSELFGVLRCAQELAGKTDGAFDVTVGPVVRLWRRTRWRRRFPSPEAIKDALTRVGYRKLILDEANRTAQLTVPQMRLDLGGIAKGAACDQALAAMRELGVASALVEGGGDLALGDPPPGRLHWRIEVADPTRDGETASRALSLRNSGVATSGDRYQFTEIDGVRYSHIVDPKTGVGMTDHRQVTVVAPTGQEADAFASALSVLPVADGVRLIEATPNAAARIVRTTAEGIEVFESIRWQQLIEP